MGFSPSDMEFMKGKDAAAREIALAFGVPPLVLGLPGDNTHANYAEANRAFQSQTIRPLNHPPAGHQNSQRTQPLAFSQIRWRSKHHRRRRE